MAISERQILDMVMLCKEQPYTATQLSKRLGIDRQAIYNFLTTKKGQFYFQSQKIDGFKFLRSDPHNHHLIKGKAKLKPMPKTVTAACAKINENTDIAAIPEKCGFERKQALRKMKRIKGFGGTVEKKDKNGKPILNEKGKPVRVFNYFSAFHKRQYNECLDLFNSYIQKIDQMELCFEPTDDFFGDTVVKPYATRFNNVSKQITLRENYEKAFKGGEEQFQKASFVTLTTDPKRFNDVVEANVYFQKNWNKLITYLRKKTGRKLPYVCVREFQRNGRVHFHVCIFGMHLPATKKNAKYNNPISKLWNRYGQGKITDVKNLVNKDGVMQWEHDRPTDCKKDEPPMKYLKKYLLKAQYDETAQFQYWIYNARYYTYSQTLFRTPKRRRHKPIYKYVGTIDREAGKFYRRKGTAGIQRHALSLGTGKAPPEKPVIKEELPTGFLTAQYYDSRRSPEVTL